jgi:hypothetical protein
MAAPAPIVVPMPPPRRKHSPYYDGKPRHLNNFIREYEVAADAAMLDDAARVDRVVDYVKPRIADYWSRFPEYTVATKRWDTFKAAVLKDNPEASLEQRYSLSELRRLTKRQSKDSIKSLSDLASYTRSFKEISSWLIDNKHIAELERDQAYLKGFKPSFRTDLNHRLQVKFPDEDPNKPLGFDKVYEAALYVLKQRGRYQAKSSHRHRGSSDRSESDSGRSSSSGSSDSESDSASEDNKHRKKASKSPPAVTSPPPPVVTIKAEPIATQGFERIMQQMIQNQTNALTAAIATLAGSKAPPVANVASTPTVPSAGARYSGCSFCGINGHYISQCPTVDEYVKAGKAARDANGKVVTSNGRFVPRGAPGQTLKERLDLWLSQNQTSMASSNIVETLFFEGEISVAPVDGSGDEDELIHHLESFTTELHQKRANRKQGKANQQTPINPERPKNVIRIPPRPQPPIPAIAPVLIPAPPLATTQHPPVPPIPTVPQADAPTKPKYKLQSPADDETLNEETMKMILGGKLDERLTVKHMLAASPPLRAKFNSYLRNQRVEVPTQSTNVVENTVAVFEQRYNQEGLVVGHSSVPLREVLVLVNGSLWERALLDEGSTICVIRKDLWQDLGAHANPSHSMRMEGANSDVQTTLGEVQDVALTFGSITVYIQFQIVMKAPFRLLLGRPFFSLTKSSYDNIENHGSILTVRDPNDPSKVLAIPTMERSQLRKEEDAAFFTKGG